MRPLRVRLTLFRMMVVVAAVGVALGVGVEVARLAQLASSYRKKAADCADTERNLVDSFYQNPHPGNQFLMDSAAYYGGLKRKYEAAARRPWVSVPPDPPVRDRPAASPHGHGIGDHRSRRRPDSPEIRTRGEP
jgi:hypothetical protein